MLFEYLNVKSSAKVRDAERKIALKPKTIAFKKALTTGFLTVHLT